jgi:hypothetical protein
MIKIFEQYTPANQLIRAGNLKLEDFMEFVSKVDNNFEFYIKEEFEILEKKDGRLNDYVSVDETIMGMSVSYKEISTEKIAFKIKINKHKFSVKLDDDTFQTTKENYNDLMNKIYWYHIYKK